MRNTKQQPKQRSKDKKQKNTKQTPFRDTGGVIGASIGNMFGNGQIGRNIGKWLGTGIGSIFGSGDYAMMGPTPNNNVLVNGAQIPRFDGYNKTSNIVSHREYLRDIQGTTAFTNTSLPLNPGLFTTFPWLSNLAQCYQEYIMILRQLNSLFYLR